MYKLYLIYIKGGITRDSRLTYVDIMSHGYAEKAVKKCGIWGRLFTKIGRTVEILTKTEPVLLLMLDTPINLLIGFVCHLYKNFKISCVL